MINNFLIDTLLFGSFGYQSIIDNPTHLSNEEWKTEKKTIHNVVHIPVKGEVRSLFPCGGKGA
jgi:hypothetical protein